MTLYHRVAFLVLFPGVMAVVTACVIVDIRLTAPVFPWLLGIMAVDSFLDLIQDFRRLGKRLGRHAHTSQQSGSTIMDQLANACRILDECLRQSDRRSKDSAIGDLVMEVTCGICALLSFIAGAITGDGIQFAWAAIMVLLAGYTEWGRRKRRTAHGERKLELIAIKAQVEEFKARLEGQ